MSLTIGEALKLGIEAHKLGKLQEADRCYTAILKMDPKHPDANHNMGVLAVNVGKVEASLPFFKTAVEIGPKVIEFWLSYINALINLNRISEAEMVLTESKLKGIADSRLEILEESIISNQDTKKKLGINSEPPEELLKPLLISNQQKQFEVLLQQAQGLLSRFPKSALLHNIHGIANEKLNRLDIAIQCYQKSLKFKPNFAEPYNNLGCIFNRRSDYNSAIENFKLAIDKNPTYPEAYYNISVAYHALGDLYRSLENCRRALELKPNYTVAYHHMGKILKDGAFNKPYPSLFPIIDIILDKNYIRPIAIASAIISLLKFEPFIKKLLDSDMSTVTEDHFTRNIEGMLSTTILMKLMKFSTIPDFHFETVLSATRYRFLKLMPKLKFSPSIWQFQSALALHCFVNEYVYDLTSVEVNAISALETKVKKKLVLGKQPKPHEVLCLASYKALYQYDWSESLLKSEEIAEVFDRQILEPEIEMGLKDEIATLKKITNAVSLKVTEQYEEHPYPRWINLGEALKNFSLAEIINILNLKVRNDIITEVIAPDILVAGCGTGHHSITVASIYKNSKVLAFDLSLSSLAFAKRKSDEFGVTNIDYIQADILDIDGMERQFDVIECSGVLHHMDDPLLGWRVLTDCLKPGGLMKIGLYSELARTEIVELQKEIKQKKIGNTPSEMKMFRKKIIELGKTRSSKLSSFGDLFSLSEFRDLLFHVKEHRFTLEQIKTSLAELGLVFCGFDNENLVRDFKKNYSEVEDIYNLEKWNEYEKINPHIFRGMYQFYCQKVICDEV